MRQVPRYRLDNTDGYTQVELNRLSARFAERAENAGDDDFDTLDWLAEQVLADYDTEQANGLGFGAVLNGPFAGDR